MDSFCDYDDNVYRHFRTNGCIRHAFITPQRQLVIHLEHFFVFVAPFIGAIGGFLTGSNAGSNAMFIKLQMQTAQNVALPWQYVTTLQNTASSVATIACPSRITLGAYLCNIPYRENELLKKTTLMIFGAVLLVVVEVIVWYMLRN